ncbi:MAG: transcriptional regulator [Brevundimonas sp.]|jgi:DNA-binding MarR family transcriptional regulator|nr:transcriptional regulator [Brevundimonas sp.]MCZ8322654.1 transcriptional regulator [Novosphingobium sp.]
MTAPDGFDPLIHPPARLQLLTVLSRVDELEFAAARNLLQVSDSVLSKHVALLAEPGYVTLRKAAVMGRQRTWLAITPVGEDAYSGHVAALRRMLAED